jgi:hypothetical protein
VVVSACGGMGRIQEAVPDHADVVGMDAVVVRLEDGRWYVYLSPYSISLVVWAKLLSLDIPIQDPSQAYQSTMQIYPNERATVNKL